MTVYSPDSPRLARRGGWCKWCRSRIEWGDAIAPSDKRGWLHAGCADQAGAAEQVHAEHKQRSDDYDH